MNSKLLSAKTVDPFSNSRRLTGLNEKGEPISLLYHLKRHARSKRLILRWTEKGAVVTAPVCATLETIDRFVFEQREWLLKKMKQAQEAERLPFPLIFPFRGGLVKIELNASVLKWEHVSETQWVLRVPISDRADKERVRQKIATLLRHEARQILAERFERIQKKVPQKASAWRLSSARRRWGSCNPKLRTINLSWRLVGCSDEVIDYVIAHELAHLREANHSKNFWIEVEKIDPQYREHEQKIKQIRSEMFPGL